MQLEKTQYYLNTQTGDIYFVNWSENIPNLGSDWVEISEQCYKVLTKHIFGE